MRPRRIALPLTALVFLLACSPEDREFSTDAASSSGGSGGTGGVGGGVGGAGGTGGEGGSEPACMPDEVIPCYSGLPGTMDVGVCKGGTQTCLPDQTGFGPCDGEVVPAAESCADAADEDCDAAPECGAALWAKVAGDAGFQYGRVVATDADGNVIVVGGFDGTLEVGKIKLVSAGDEDAFVAKFDPDGVLLWARRFGAASLDTGLGVAVAPNGDIVVTGSFQGAVDFGNGSLTSAGLSDIFLLRLAAVGGATVWSRRFGDATSQSTDAVAVDPVGNVILAGGYVGTVDFGLGPLASAGSNDAFVAKYNPAGVALWVKRFGDAGSQVISDVQTDMAGNIFVAGTNSSVIDLGGGQLTADIYLAKLDAGGGSHIWSKGFGDAGVQSIGGLAVQGGANPVLLGRYSGSIDFGGGALVDAKAENVYVVKFDAGGNHVFSRGFVTNFIKHLGGAVAADPTGNVLITGTLHGTMDFGFGPVTAKSPTDAYALALDSKGATLWAQVFGGDLDQVGRGIAADAAGNVFVVGTVEGTIDFGLGMAEKSAGATDIFLVKLAP